MIFSGNVGFYMCEACALEYSNTTPTSLLPIVGVVAIAADLWARVVSLVIPYRWLSLLLGVIVAIGSLWIIYLLVDAFTTRKLRRGICPKCGGKLIRTGGGFYDGLVPNAWELLIYALVIALPFVAAVATRHGG